MVMTLVPATLENKVVSERQMHVLSSNNSAATSGILAGDIMLNLLFFDFMSGVLLSKVLC